MIGPSVHPEDSGPSLRLRKGKMAVFMPPLGYEGDEPPAVTIRCSRGDIQVGTLPKGEKKGVTSSAYLFLDGVSPLDGFSLLLDEGEAFKLPRKDFVLFDRRGRTAEYTRGRSFLVRRPGKGPDVDNPLSTTLWEGAEVVQFDAPERGFEIAKPSVRFRDGHSYLYVSRYVGLPGDEFWVSITGDFGDIVLGRMIGATSGGLYIAKGTEFRLSDHGVTVLDGFDLLIDGRKVFTNPQSDVRAFTPRGTVAAFPKGTITAVFFDDVDVDVDAEMLEEHELTTGIVYRIYSSENHMSFNAKAADDSVCRGIEEEPDSTGDAGGYYCLDESDEGGTGLSMEDYLAAPAGSFVRFTPRMVMHTSGIVRSFCICVPEYKPLSGTEPNVFLVQDGAEVDLGQLPMEGPVTSETEVDILSNGVDPLGTFSLKIEGKDVFSSKAINILFFTKEGIRISKPRGRVVAMHRPELRLGVRGKCAKVRMIRSEDYSRWTFDEAELGAKGVFFNSNVEV